jgi:phosphoethanolamine N-methyltransferase
LAYDETFVAALEWMWGEGFLSPGGPAEVAEIVAGVDLAGKRVLDIGCGLGGVDFVLLENHGVAELCGVDTEAPLLERARRDAVRRGLGARVEFLLVAPGPLPLADASFDVAFTKDSIIHVEDKAALFRDVYRVLRPGGVFVGGDWLGAGRPASAAMRAWLEIVGLQFALCTAAQIEDYLRGAGFTQVRTRDRNDWYRAVVREEIASVAGENQQRLAAELGAEAAEHRLRSSQMKLAVVDSGELRPTHFRALRPPRAAAT